MNVLKTYLICHLYDLLYTVIPFVTISNQLVEMILNDMQNKEIYETCPLHPKEYLQVVCLQCEVNSIACPLCIDISHKNHLMISLKKFLAAELPKLYNKKPDHQLLQKVIRFSFRESMIQVLPTKMQMLILIQLFQKLRKSVAAEINQLEKEYKGEIQALYQQTNVVCGVGEHLYTMKNISLIKKKIKSNQKLPQNKDFVAKIGELCEKMSCLVGEVTEDVCEIIRSLRSFWQASKELLLNSKRQFKFAFSSSLKHKALSIELNNWQGRKMVNQIYDNSYHIGVIQPPLNPFKNQVKLRVQKSNNRCVWIGICDLKKIIDRRFSNCYKKGDGAYWIWQAGCRGGAQYFSNILNDSQTLPWNFDIGDIVKVRLVYEKQSRFVQFEKNSQKIFRGKLDKANVYCACVGMGAEQQSVIIMQS